MIGKIQKLRLCKAKKRNSSYINTLYAVFDDKGKFLYYQVEKVISEFLEDFIEVGYTFPNTEVEEIPKFK